MIIKYLFTKNPITENVNSQFFVEDDRKIQARKIDIFLRSLNKKKLTPENESLKHNSVVKNFIKFFIKKNKKNSYTQTQSLNHIENVLGALYRRIYFKVLIVKPGVLTRLLDFIKKIIYKIINKKKAFYIPRFDKKYLKFRTLFYRLFGKQVFHQNIYARTLWFLLMAFPGLYEELNLLEPNTQIIEIINKLFEKKNKELINKLEQILFNQHLFTRHLIICHIFKNVKTQKQFINKLKEFKIVVQNDPFTYQNNFKNSINQVLHNLYKENSTTQEKINNEKMKDKIITVLTDFYENSH